MASFKGTVTTAHSPEQVWRYLADLRSVAEWDPSVTGARLLGGEPRTLEAAYEIDVAFAGRGVSVPYRTTVIEPPGRVVFEAETDAVSIRDEATVRPLAGGGSAVTWSANLELKGPRRLFELPLRLLFNRIGDAAEDGLRERLSEPLPASTREALAGRSA